MPGGLPPVRDACRTGPFFDRIFADMNSTLLFLIIGFPLLIGGAYALVRGSGSLALRLGVSELTVGLTVVAMGTSAPELVVSLLSAFQGATDLAVGNVIGSNITNILLILGLSAVVVPLRMEASIRWREIPFALLAVLVLAALANDSLLSGSASSQLDRGEGLALLGFFAVYLYYLFSVARRTEDLASVEVEPPLRLDLSIGLSLIGVAALALGGKWIVQGAASLATALGMSQALIGLTVVAVGTSLPELATSLVAALRGNADMAIGNVVGSNIFNVLWILGVTSSVTTVAFNPLLNTDLWVLAGATLLLFTATWTGSRHRIDRIEGALFLLLYAAYTAFIVLRG